MHPDFYTLSIIDIMGSYIMLPHNNCSCIPGHSVPGYEATIINNYLAGREQWQISCDKFDLLCAIVLQDMTVVE